MTDVTVEDGDDGLRCWELTIYTRAWQLAYEDYCGTEFFVRIEREDKCVVGPIGVRNAADLSTMITELTPPFVSIRSAPGENVEALKGLVEAAKAGGQVH